MAVRLLPWQPEYGAGMAFAAAALDEEADGPEDGAAADIAVERDTWAPVTPRVPLPGVQIVDGVRRVEAHAIEDVPGAPPVFGLFGSFAVGAVRCELPGAARVIEDRVRVERRYLHGGESGEDRTLQAGAARLTFQARAVPAGATSNDLVAALNQAMLDEEARLADDLSRDESVVTLVDGPLRSFRSPGRRVVGYVKRIQNWYVGPAEVALLPTLDLGERTPLFLISGSPAGSGGGDGRYSWYVRLARLGPETHPLGGILRAETSASLPLAGAAALADQVTVLLPRLASSPVRDPRAPQNLTPVGALEARLTHLLGDRLLIRRMLTASISRTAREVYA